MANLTTNILGTEYPLATTLRVAYMVQGQHNHAPYTEVFKNIGDMPLEDQIGIIYCAFKCANPEVSITMTLKNFTDYYLDNVNLKTLMQQLQELIKGILGTEDENAPETSEEAPQGN